MDPVFVVILLLNWKKITFLMRRAEKSSSWGPVNGRASIRRQLSGWWICILSPSGALSSRIQCTISKYSSVRTPHWRRPVASSNAQLEAVASEASASSGQQFGEFPYRDRRLSKRSLPHHRIPKPKSQASGYFVSVLIAGHFNLLFSMI